MKIYLPGDIVKCNIVGGNGVVVTSQMLVNGGTINWNDAEYYRELLGTSKKNHYFGTEIEFQYACEHFPGEKMEKHAWYYTDELTLIKRGAVYDILCKKYSLNKLE